MKEAQKIRQKSIAENKRDLAVLREKLMNLNFEKQTGTLKKTHQIRQAKRQIARLINIIQEQETKKDKNNHSQS